MSATNTTTNYNLPIFIGADKPSWLADFNGAMNAIDAQMKVNADAIATKSPILTFNDTTEIDLTKSGNIITANLASGVADKVGRALVTPVAAPASEEIVSIDTNGSQHSLELGTGLVIDNGVLNAIDLNLNHFTTVSSVSGLPSGASFNSGTITSALNSDSTIGKIYGSFSLRNTTSGTLYIDVDTGLIVSAPQSQYDIAPAGLRLASGGNFSAITYTVHTNGHVYLSTSLKANDYNYIYLFPCIYFFKDFGDVPTP